MSSVSIILHTGIAVSTCHLQYDTGHVTGPLTVSQAKHLVLVVLLQVQGIPLLERPQEG